MPPKKTGTAKAGAEAAPGRVQPSRGAKESRVGEEEEEDDGVAATGRRPATGGRKRPVKPTTKAPPKKQTKKSRPEKGAAAEADVAAEQTDEEAAGSPEADIERTARKPSPGKRKSGDIDEAPVVPPDRAKKPKKAKIAGQNSDDSVREDENVVPPDAGEEGDAREAEAPDEEGAVPAAVLPAGAEEAQAEQAKPSRSDTVVPAKGADDINVERIEDVDENKYVPAWSRQEAREDFAKKKKNFPKWLDKDGDWRGAWQLGAGGMGVTYAYYKLDDNQQIADRIVVKDSYVPHLHWGQLHHWYGDMRDPDRREHMEIKAMQNIWHLPGSDRCVELRHSEKDDKRKFYRIYMNYCGYGSMHQLVKDFGEEGLAYHGPDQDPIPEPAIWWFLECMTEACLLMQYGGVEENEARPGWEAIVHRDLKLGNIFLDEPKPHGPFAEYPVARVGDYGIAIMTSNDDPMNPDAYNYAQSTLCWAAPEQEAFLNPKTKDPIEPALKLGEATNVWGVGAIAIRLMNQECYPQGPHYGRPIPIPDDASDEKRQATEQLNAYRGALEPTPHSAAKTKYSEQLCELVQRCVRYKPASRIKLHKLRQEIRRYTTAGDEDLASDMRNRARGAAPAAHHLRYQPDQYRLGLNANKIV